ncbi:NADAR family protein [Nocardioides sp. WG-D5]|uniref:NADAR family protein n=1 Tax=Nocardioides luteus TaxID=1844 RepID=UPI0005926F31|nr:NADAR family protein [Nocardioides luteus]MBG6095617.1 ribA/ribD-fused uncharacterized protein [Nocardioides luteus]
METEQALRARSVEELVAAYEAGERPRYVHFWGHTPKGPGVGMHVLSQWWPKVFADADGRSFASAEHYMMWRKAVLFGDDRTAARILDAASPGAAKALGREVSGFEDEVWLEHRWRIVVEGSTLKFGSDPALRDYLLATRGRVLVEASPRDRIWGIGLGKSSPYAEEPARWNGLNLLGFALMEARNRL